MTQETWRTPEYQSKTNAQDEYAEQEARIRARAAVIKHQVLVLSGKGGVGKSTVAANLAWSLAVKDLRVGLLDADINGPTIPLMMGLQGTRGVGFMPAPVMENLHVMSISFFLDSPDTPTIWRGPLKGGIIRQFIGDVEWGPLDYLIVDLPPGTGDEPLTIAQSFPEADGGVIVTTPQEASLAVCRKAINFLHAVKLPCLGVIENMSGFICPKCSEMTPVFAQGGGLRMAERMGVPFLGELPLSPEVVTLADQGRPAIGAGSSEALRKSFDSIVNNLLAATEST